MTLPQQLMVVTQATPKNTTHVGKVALFKEDGTPFPASAFSQTAAQADVGAVTSVVAAGANPTKAEYDALRADALATRTVLNALLAKMRTSGQLATS